MAVDKLREKIDSIDDKILKLVEDRYTVSQKIGAIKRKKGIPVEDLEREETIFARLTLKTKLNKKFVRKLFSMIIGYCKDHE